MSADPIPHFDAAVVGGGIIGAACAYALGQERAIGRLVLLERDEVGGGVTSAAAGLCTLLTKRPDLQIALAAESMRFHEDWAARLPGVPLHRAPTLMVFEAPEEALAADVMLESVRRFDPWVERLSPGEVAVREPAWCGPCHGGLLSPGGFRVDPPRLAEHWAAHAVGPAVIGLPGDPGSRLRLCAELEELDDRAGSWFLRTSAGDLTADHVVLAAGLETAGLAARLGWVLPLRSRRGQMAIAEPPPGFLRNHVLAAEYLAAKFDAGPPADPEEEGPLEYSFAAVLDGDAGVWIGSTRRFAADGRLRGDERIRLLHGAMQRLRGFDPGWVTDERSGRRPWTPDGLPLIGRLPDRPNLYVAAGHEGDGVMLAPVTGRIIADLIIGRTPRLDTAPLRPDRFGRRWMPVSDQTDTLS